MTYRKGDRVLIVDYITDSMDGYDFDDCLMAQYCGQLMTIDYVDENEHGTGQICTMLEDNGDWAWFEDTIESKVQSAISSLKTTYLPNL